MTYLLKRILPFVLTAFAGLILVYQWKLYNQPVPQVESLVNSQAEQSPVYSYYDYHCKCMFWTTDSKKWVSIKELPKPNFTEEARRNSYSGGVQMLVLLGDNGRVLQATPYGSLPYGLTEEIVSAAKRIRFEPASVFDGYPESVWVGIGYHFKTVPGVLGDTYETSVEILDHFDIDHNGHQLRLER